MTPDDLRAIQRIVRDELQRERLDIVAEAKRHATGSDLAAEAAHGAAIAHERTVMRAHVRSELEPLRRRVAHWTRNPWVDLVIRILATVAATYAAISAAK